MKYIFGFIKNGFRALSIIFCLALLLLFLALANCGGGGGDGAAAPAGGGTPPPNLTTGFIADHNTAANFNSIPESAINNAKSTLHIAYGHTSHGTQITTGLEALANADSLYNGLDLRDQPFSGASDLGNPDRTSWATATRNYLNTHPEVNVIIWSWCGQVSDASEANINTYLNLMNQLEIDYPSVNFVYMTGHLDGSGTSGNLNVRNEQIRVYCTANNKILFDFADIESYDPDGNEFMTLNATDSCSYDGGNWATEWTSNPANSGNILTQLAANCDSKCYNNGHSRGLNCALKGRALWWLLARIAGWTP